MKNRFRFRASKRLKSECGFYFKTHKGRHFLGQFFTDGIRRSS